jgi:16S rRNA (adenine1518-N6/adenine1519-N6)-dimethyltransferase
MPSPKVGSAVIRLTRHKQPPVQVEDEALMFRLIRASFNQRRKTLVNGLKNSQELSFSKEEIEEALKSCDLPLTIRGEALDLKKFAELANALTKPEEKEF